MKILKEMQPFIIINNSNIKEKNLFTILLPKYKEKYTYDCECRKDKKKDVFYIQVKYNTESYPELMLLLFDMQMQG